MSQDQKFRAGSPVVDRWAYFDTAAASAPTATVIDTVCGYLQRTAEDGPYLPAFRREVYQRVDEVRALAARYLNVTPEEISYVKNATEGICIIAQGIDWQPGDEVIVPNFENLSNIVPWLRLAKRRGIRVVRVNANEEGLLELDTVKAAITPKTRLITFSQLPNATGAIQPAYEICQLAKQHGILTMLNAAESLGMLAIDVQQLGCDILVACGRKALRATEGSGLLYVRRELIPQIEPCLVGWWNAGYDIETGVETLPDTGKRFEAGCPVVPAILGLGIALEEAMALGAVDVEQRVRDLTGYAAERLGRIPGFEMYGPRELKNRIGILPFNIRSLSPDAIVEKLEAQGIILEAGHFMAQALLAKFGVERMTRISLHYFNNEAEIDRAAELIEAML